MLTSAENPPSQSHYFLGVISNTVLNLGFYGGEQIPGAKQNVSFWAMIRET